MVSQRCLTPILNWKADRFNQHMAGFERTHTSLIVSLKQTNTQTHINKHTNKHTKKEQIIKRHMKYTEKYSVEDQCVGP